MLSEETQADDDRLARDAEPFKVSKAKRRINSKSGFMRQIVHIQNDRALYEQRMRQQRKERSTEMWEEKMWKDRMNEDHISKESSKSGEPQITHGRTKPKHLVGDLIRGGMQSSNTRRMMTRTQNHYVPKARRRQVAVAEGSTDSRKAKPERSREKVNMKSRARPQRKSVQKDAEIAAGMDRDFENSEEEEKAIRKTIKSLRLRIKEIQARRNSRLQKVAGSSDSGLRSSTSGSDQQRGRRKRSNKKKGVIEAEEKRNEELDGNETASTDVEE